MVESVQITVKLRGVSRREGKSWVAGCPKLNVWSQGTTQTAARAALQEAVELWFEDCLSRGTLDAALREVGFHPVPWGTTVPESEEAVRVVKAAPDEVMGSTFPLAVSIPAYQAAQLLEVSADR